MAKQYKVVVNAGKDIEKTVLDVPKNSGAQGKPLTIKAKAGHKYQLVETTDLGNGKQFAPDFVKTRRVGKNLLVTFEGGRQADLIIEDYYDVFSSDVSALIGQAENGSFYEYIPEDPNTNGLVANLREGGQAVNVALGGAEVQGAGAAVGLLAINPLLGALGLAGAGAAAVAAANTGTTTTTTTPISTTAALASTSDSGTLGDNRTNNKTPSITGTAPAGSAVSVVINNAQGTPVGTFTAIADASGKYTINVPNTLADGTYTSVITVTPAGSTTPNAPVNGTPFTIDTTPGTIAIAADKTSLVKGETSVITFTLSEAASDFTKDDIAVTGGTLGNLVPSTTNPLVYTATFTPTPDSTTPARISVASAKFSDAASNFNTDGDEANNKLDLTINTLSNGGTASLASGSDTGKPGDNLTKIATPEITGKAPANAAVSVNIDGVNYTTTADANGNYSVKVPNNLKDKTYTPVITVTPAGSTTPSAPVNGTPFTIDTTPGTIAIAADKTSLVKGESSVITFTLSEAASDFTKDDIAITGGTLGNLVQSTTNPLVYTATFTPATDSAAPARISVASGKLSDAASNFNTDGDEANNKLDLPVNTLTNGGTAVLAPASDSGTKGDNLTKNPTPSITGKAPAGANVKVTVNNVDYTTTAGADGTYTIPQVNNLPDGPYTPKITVTVGTTVGTPTDGTPFVIDTTPPTIALSSDKTALSTGQTTQISFTLSEPVTDFSKDDVEVTGGTLSNFQGSGKNYTATFTPTPGSTADSVIRVRSGLFADAAANTNTDGNDTNNVVTLKTDTTTVDTTAPTIAITSDKTALKAGDTAVITFTLSEPSGNFELADITVTGGQLSNLQPVPGETMVYKAVFTPTAGSTVQSVISVASDKFSDASGNFNKDGSDANNTVRIDTNTVISTNGTAALASTSDSGTQGDNRTLDNTPDITGTAPAGSAVSVVINNAQGAPVGTYTATADASGKYTLNVPAALADGTYTPVVTVTPVGGTPGAATNGTPFVIDTVTTVAITQPGTAGTTNLIEGTAEAGDIVVLKDNNGQVIGSTTASSAGNWSFTPTSPVPAGKVTATAQDAAGNNANATGTPGSNNTSTFTLNNDSATAIEAGASNPTGTQINMTATSGVLANDTGTNVLVSGIKLNSATTTNGVSSGSTSTSNFTTVTGQYGTLQIGADGSYTYTVDNNNPTVQALRTAGQTVSEVFTYTGSNGSTTGSANLTVTINGSNDAPVAVADTLTALEAGGTNNTTAGTAPVSNVLSNDTDVDFGDQKFVQDIKLGTNASTSATLVPSTGSAPVTGTYGTLSIAADGSYSYAVDNNNATVQALRTASQTVSETFTYTVKDLSGATSTNTITVTVQGANDAPTYTTGGLTAQTVTAGDTTKPLNYQFAATAFNDVDSSANGETATYSATLADGSKLPDWLSFNPVTHTFSGTPPANTPAGTITVKVTNTDAGGLGGSGNFDIVIGAAKDTTPPKVAISSNQASLSAGQTATITFTLSEASTDFTWNSATQTGDISVSGGQLGALTTTDNITYTAIFTPNANSAAAGVIRVGARQFQDASGNQNLDTWNSADTGAVVEANNTVTLSINTNGAAASLNLANDAQSVAEAGLNTPASNASGNVLSNDAGNTPKVSGIQLVTDTTAKPVNPGTSAATGTTITGQYGSLAIGADGQYIYTVDNNNPTVQALRTAGQTVSEVFAYTATDSTGAKSANLVVTITGTNDAPTLTTQVADQTGTVGSALKPLNVSTNFADVDAVANGETATYTIAPTSGNTLPAWLSINPSTGAISGTPTAAGTTSVVVTRTDAAGASVSDTFDIVVSAPAGTTSGQLADTSDTGTKGDNKTNDKTPDLTGTVPLGSTAEVKINGVTYPVTVKPDGTWAFTQPTDLPDGVYTPELSVTPAGGGTPVKTNLTPFTIDTVAPTVAISASTAVLVSGQTSTLTFTLSEASGDFTNADISTTGGSLGALVQSSTDPKVYTAVFTPNSTATSATITVDSERFSDAAGNTNKDTSANPAPAGTIYEANNKVFLATNASTNGQLSPNSDSATKGDNLTNNPTPAITGKAPAGAAVKVTVNNVDYTTTADANGDYTIPQVNTLPDGPYTPVITVTPVGGSAAAPVNGTPFTVDTTTPTVAISASSSTLLSGQTRTLTFTLSEASADFTNADVITTGGTLSPLVKSSTDPKVYTAVFTPTSTATSATIAIDSERFSDAAGNTNKDTFVNPASTGTTYEANNQVTLSTNFVSTGALSPNTDSATKGDNLTNNPTPAITGKAPAGAAVKVTVDGVDYTTTADPNGNYTIPAVAGLKDGPYTPVITVTPVGGAAGTPVNGTPFTIDTTAPTVAISASNAVLTAGQTSTITFTLSEAATDFVGTDIAVTGGSLGTLMQSSTDPKVYTAVFTPDSTGKSATITVDSARFSDAAGNTNKDTSVNPAPAGSTYEANNQVFLATNAVTNGQLTPATDSGTKGDNKTNDKTPELSGNAPAGSTAEVKINGVKYPVTVKPDGTWAFTQPTDLPDGTYVPELYVTPAGGGTPVKTDLTPFTIDTVAPTVAIIASSTSLTAGQTSVITFTLSEAATDFSNADIAVTGGTLSTLSSTDGKVYTATFTPTSVATSAVIKIDSNKFSDAAANFNTDTAVNPAPTGAVYEANNQVTLATNVAPQDNTPPTVIVTRNGSGTLTSSETITFTLSEASKDFTKDDISVDSGDISNFTPVTTSGSAATGYTQYTATYTPKTGASGQATIGVLAGKFSDAAGNLNKDTFAANGSTDVLEDNNKVAISFNTLNPAPDTTPPTVIVARAGTGSLAAGGSDTITFTLSENSLTFDQSDITVDGGILTNWTIVTSSGSPSTGYHQYTATFTPNPASSGTATIGVKASTFKDFAGNANQDTFEANQVGTTFETNNVVSIGYNTSTQDTTPPTVAVVRSSAGTLTGPETIYFNFSEATTDFALGDITVDGGSMSNLVAVAGSGNKQYSATFTPTASSTGTASIGVLSGKFSDASGNLNLDTFDASSTHYETNNLVSAAYNTNNGSNLVDTTAPKVAITRLGSGTVGTGPGTSGASETIVFSFSETIDPASFTAADVDVSSGTISAISAVPGSNNTQFTATYTPLTGLVGNATIGIVAGKFSDVAGNLNLDTYMAPTTGSQQVQESNNQITLGYNSDTTAPTVIVSRATSSTVTVTGTETITFTLSEPSTSFSKEDIDLIGTGPLGTLGTLTPDTTSGNANTGYTRYSIVYTAPANNSGDIKIGVLAGKFSDAVGNLNTDTYAAGNGKEDNNAVDIAYNTYPVDRMAPTIAVARSGSGTLTGANGNETITFTLSEASTNFSESDITTTGGTLSNFAAVTTSGTAGTGYTRYTATFTPTAGSSGTATVGVKSGQFSDNAGNTNQDSYELTGAENANNQVSIAYNSTVADTTPPTIIVARTGTGTLAAGQTETLLFTTSEVAHFDETRITVIKGGTLSNVAPVASSGSLTTGYTQWTATFTPTPGSSGQAQIGVLNGKVDDLAGNFNTDTYTQGQAGTVYEANNLVSFNYDTNTKDSTAPTIVVSRSGSGTVKTGETLFFTLSEASKDFADTDIDVTGGALTGFTPVLSSGNASTGYTQYVATFTPDSGKGVATIGVKSGKFSDAALNPNADTYEQGATGYEANNQVFLDFDNASTDTTPPTVAVIRSTSNVLKVGATELVTFVLSEASLDFTLSDIAYDGGTLSEFTRVTSSGNSTKGYTQYTALFTPNANSAGTASIGVVHGKFTDAANLLNQDTYLAPATGSTQVQEGNNQVKIVFNTVPASGPGANADTASATEAGGNTNSALGINPNGSVLDNDTTATTTKVVQDINIANGTAKAVAANSSKDSNATSITGSYGTLLIGADGTYSYTVNNQSAAVEALRTNTDTLTDTFTYTINDGTSATASTTLAVTVHGANDAPVLVTAVADTSATIGTPFSYAFASTTFKDVDTGDTLSYSAKLAGGADLPSWLSFNPATRTFSGTAPAGAPSALDIQITATDKGTLTASDTFQITIGNNHAPTLAPISAPAAIAELANAAAQDIAAINGVLVVNDVDTGNTINASSTAASVVWSGGSALPQGADVSELISSTALKFGTGVTPNGSAQNLSWTYDPKAANLDWLAQGQTLTLTYPVTINDGQNGSATQNLVITITGTNDAPVASNIAKPYNKGAGTDSFSLIGNATDLDTGETAGLTLDSATPVTYSIDGGAASTSLPAGITLSGNTLSIDPANAAFAALITGQSQVIVVTYKIKDINGATTEQTATLTINGSGTGTPIATNDLGSITEQGGQSNNIGSTFVQNDSLLQNDSAFGGATLLVNTIKAGTAAGTGTSVATTGNTQVTGQFGTLSVNKSGGNTYELNNNLAAVQALQAGETLTDTFTYTIKDSNGKTSAATLTMTINGANDAPVAVADTITVGEAGGSANATASTLSTTGSLLANDTDVDITDRKTVSAIRTSTGSDQTVAAGTSSTVNPKQISGGYGTLSLGADGSYSYAVDDNLLAVQQLKNVSDKLTDTFTYTVKDAAGLSSTNTLTITITGANDAPKVSVATAPTSATNLKAFNFGTAFSLADVDVGNGLMTLTLNSDANDGRITVNLGSSGATLTSGGNGTSNAAVITGTLAQLQALTSAAGSFSFVDSATQTATRDITISAVLNDQGNEGALANALTGSNSFKVSMAADPNRNATIDITAITNDTGYQANDYITADNTLVFSGTVSGLNVASGRVKLELVDSNNQVLQTTIVTPTVSNGNGTWTWTDPLETGSTIRADGDYSLRATIVDLNGNRVNPASTVGSNTGTQDVQAITIDTNTPNVDPNRFATIDIVTIDDGLSTSNTANGSKDSGTSATDFITSDRTLAYKGTVTGWQSNNGDMVKLELKDSSNATVATQYVLPQTTSGSSMATWAWDDTGVTRDADSTYTLVATIVDKAGNRVNAAEPTNGTNGGTDSQVIVIDNTAPTIVVSSDKATVQAGGTTTITFTLSEASTDFVESDVQFSGGTISNFQGSGTTYTATFTLASNATAAGQVWVASSKFSDAAGNLNADGADLNNAASVTPAKASVIQLSTNSSSYIENAPAGAVNSTITVTDADSPNLTGATVKIDPANFQSTDLLSFTNANGITGSYNSATGTMTLSGTASVADYQEALRSIQFSSTSDNPGTQRTINWTVTDDLTTSATVNSTINVTPVNDAPVAVGTMTNQAGLYASTNLAGLGTILSLPATNGTYSIGSVPTGWVVSSQTPDIVTGADKENTGGGRIIGSSINGTSIDGGTMVNMWSLPNAYESMKTTLTGLTVGTSYTISVQWQGWLSNDFSAGIGGGGSLFISRGTAATKTVYSDTQSAAVDPWKVATYTFTASSTSTTIEVGADYTNSLNGGGLIVVDVLSAQQLVTAKTTAAPGATVASLMTTGANLSITDVDNGATVQGYAFTSAAAASADHWEYSSDNGSTWTAMTSASVSNAIFLKGTDLVRWVGTPSNHTELRAVVVDNTGPNAASGTALNVSTRGGTTPYSNGEIALPTETNKAPTNTVPGAKTVVEDTEMAITGISVSDTDGNLSTTELSVLNGSLRVTLSGGATIDAGSNSSGNLIIIKGTQADINATLATLKYTGASNYNGADTLSVISKDSAGATSSTSTVAITVTPVADNATITGDTTGAITEDASSAVSGTLTVTDGDAGQNVLQIPANLAGTYGNFTLTPAGAWTYTLDNTKTATQALAANANVTDKLTVTSADGTATQDINVTVTGVNDAPNAVGSMTNQAGLYASTDLTGLGTILSLPAINGAHDIDGVAAGWTAKDSPDITEGYEGEDVAGGRLVLSSLNGTSIDGGSFQTMVSIGSWKYESIYTTLTTVIGQTYTVALQWQGYLTQGMADTSSTLHISKGRYGVAGTTTQVYTSTQNSGSDPWQMATFTFTATQTSTLIEVGPHIETLNDQAYVAVDVLSAQQFINAKTTAAPGATVASLMTTGAKLSITDVDNGATVQGYAFTSAAAASADHWEYSTNNGSTWTAMTSASVSNAIFLKGTDLVRWVGTPSSHTELRAVVVDNTGPNAASGAALNVSTRGGTTPYSNGEIALPTETNKAPTNTVPGAKIVAEDTELAITGISVSDTDGNLSSTQLSVLHGSLSVTLSGSATIDAGSNSNGSLIIIKGTQADINATLATLKYTGTSNYNGADTLSVISKDSAGATSSTSTVAITVTAVADNATITGDTTGAVTEDTSSAVVSGTLTVTDGDVGQNVLQTPASLTGLYGNFTITPAGAWTYTLDNTKTATQALAAGANVTDKLTVTSADGSATKDINVTVTGVNDAPNAVGTMTNQAGLYASADFTGLGTILSLPATNGNYATSVAPTGWSLSKFTPDITTGVDGQSTGIGNLIGSSVQGTSIDGGGMVFAWSRTYNINEYESIATNLATVAGVKYTIAVEWQKVQTNLSGKIVGGGSMFISDGTTGQIYSKTLSANNDSWDVVTYTFTAKAGTSSTRIEIGANYLGAENEDGGIVFDVLSAQQFTNAKTTAAPGATVASLMTTGAKLSITDVDNGATVQGYAFTSAAAATADHWEYSTNNGSTWTAMTSASVSNAIFLKGTDLVRWVGTPSNHTELRAVVVDNTGPNAASGTTLNVSTRGGTTPYSNGEIALSTDTNIAPTNTVPGAKTVAEDTELAITGISVNDTDGNLSTTQLSVLHGSLSVTLSGGAIIDAGSNSNGSLIIIKGTQAAINATLATLKYTPTSNYNGADTLSVISKDSAGATSSTSTVAITVTSVSNNATITGDTTGAITEDASSAVSGTLTVTDGDAGQNVLQTPANLAGTYGNFTLTPAGAWTYTLDNTKTATQALAAGANVTDKLTVTSADGSATKDIKVTVTGLNDAPNMTDADGKLYNSLGLVSAAAGTAFSPAFSNTTNLTVSRTSTSGAFSDVVFNTDGSSYVTMANSTGGFNETLKMQFTQSARSLKVRLDAFTPGDTLQVLVNGQALVIDASMVGGTNSVAVPDTAGTTLVGTARTSGASVIEAFELLIDSTKVPGGINSIEFVGKSTAAGGGFKLSAPTNATPEYNNKTVAALFGGTYTDVDLDAMKGVAVTFAGTPQDIGSNGIYSYSSDNGVTWKPLVSGLSDTNAVFLAKTNLVRYLPSSLNTSTYKQDLTVRLVDASGATNSASLVSGTPVNVSSNGGTEAYSANPVTLKTLTTMSINTVTADNILSVAESTANTNVVSGTVTGQFAAGDKVTLTINNTAYTTTVNAAGQWSVNNTSGNDLKLDADSNVEASIMATTEVGPINTVANMKAFDLGFAKVTTTGGFATSYNYTTVNVNDAGSINLSPVTGNSPAGPQAFTTYVRNGVNAAADWSDGGLRLNPQNIKDPEGNGAGGEYQSGEIMVQARGGMSFTQMKFSIYDLQNGLVAGGSKIATFYDASGQSISSVTIPVTGHMGTATVDSGVLSRPAVSMGISGGNRDWALITGMKLTATQFPVPIEIPIVSTDTIVDRVPQIYGTLSQALASGEVIQIYNNGTLLGNATVSGLTWSYVPTITALSTNSFVAKVVVNATNAVITEAAPFVITQSPSGLTPLVLDLNGDGVQTTTLQNGTAFDLDADGDLDQTAWVDRRDGLLVMDLNGDNKIGDGRELFGSATALKNGEKAKDGFQALADLDGNHDGLIDANDAGFANLKVWVDANGNGVADEGELKSLQSLGIVSLKLQANISDQQQNGNTLGLISQYTTADGKTHELVDVWLDVAKDTPVKAMDPGSSSGVTNAVIPAEGTVIPASEPGSMAPGSSSGVTNAVIPAEGTVIPASEPGSMAPAQPDHCDQAWIIEPPAPNGTEPVVFKLNPESWNKPFALSAEQMSELNLPVPADNNLPGQFKLNVSDVLLNAADAYAKPALQLNGQELTADTLNLSTLLSPAAAPAHLTGTAQIEGQTFNFAANVSLQALIDQQQHHAAVS